MLFKPELCQAILTGRKTQTRRLVKPGEVSHDGMRSVAKTWAHVRLGITDHRVWVPYYAKWVVGKTYAIQPGRGKKAVGRFRLLAIRRERLQDISEADIRAEGLNSTQSLAAIWDQFSKATARREALAALGMGDYRTAFSLFWDVLIHKGRKGTRWQDNPSCWVLKLEVVKGETNV